VTSCVRLPLARVKLPRAAFSRRPRIVIHTFVYLQNAGQSFLRSPVHDFPALACLHAPNCYLMQFLCMHHSVLSFIIAAKLSSCLGLRLGPWANSHCTGVENQNGPWHVQPGAAETSKPKFEQ
jgi:hypothetical protein